MNYDRVEKTDCYTDKTTGKQKQRLAVTKNARYRQRLRPVKQNPVPFRYVLNDVWFASADNMMVVKYELERDFAMPLKTNRKVASCLEGKKQRRYVRVDTLDIEQDTIRTIYLEGVDFPLHLAKQVFTNADGILYLV